MTQTKTQHMKHEHGPWIVIGYSGDLEKCEVCKAVRLHEKVCEKPEHAAFSNLLAACEAAVGTERKPGYPTCAAYCRWPDADHSTDCAIIAAIAKAKGS